MGKHLPARHPPSTLTLPSETLRSALSQRSRHLAGCRGGERGSPSKSINLLDPPLNTLHEGYHHQLEQHRAANSSQRSPSALPWPSARQIPPRNSMLEEEEEERRLRQLPGKTPNKCPQLWGAKPAGPGVPREPAFAWGGSRVRLASLGADADARRAGTDGTTFTPCRNGAVRAREGERKAMEGLSQRVEGLSQRLEGLIQGLKGLSQRMECLSQGSEGLFEGKEGLPQEVEGRRGTTQPQGQADGDTALQVPPSPPRGPTQGFMLAGQHKPSRRHIRDPRRCIPPGPAIATHPTRGERSRRGTASTIPRPKRLTLLFSPPPPPPPPLIHPVPLRYPHGILGGQPVLTAAGRAGPGRAAPAGSAPPHSRARRPPPAITAPERGGGGGGR